MGKESGREKMEERVRVCKRESEQERERKTERVSVCKQQSKRGGERMRVRETERMREGEGEKD